MILLTQRQRYKKTLGKIVVTDSLGKRSVREVKTGQGSSKIQKQAEFIPKVISKGARQEMRQKSKPVIQVVMKAWAS